MDDFFSGGDTGKDFADSVFAQGAHAEFPGASAELVGGLLRVDECADFVVDVEKFEDTHPAAIAVAAAFFATGWAVYG